MSNHLKRVWDSIMQIPFYFSRFVGLGGSNDYRVEAETSAS